MDISKLRRSYLSTFIEIVNRSTYAPNSTYPQFSSTLQLHKYIAFEEFIRRSKAYPIDDYCSISTQNNEGEMVENSKCLIS